MCDCMDVHVYQCKYEWISVCMDVCCVFMYVCMYVCIYVFIIVCMYVCVYVCMSISSYVRNKYIRMDKDIDMLIYIYICSRKVINKQISRLMYKQKNQ